MRKVKRKNKKIREKLKNNLEIIIISRSLLYCKYFLTALFHKKTGTAAWTNYKQLPHITKKGLYYTLFTIITFCQNSFNFRHQWITRITTGTLIIKSLFSNFIKLLQKFDFAYTCFLKGLRNFEFISQIVQAIKQVFNRFISLDVGLKWMGLELGIL